jgi:nucleotide-binding universal stress UspA family protein
MIKRILIGLGGTPYTPVAIERAVTLAQRYEASLTAVTMVKREQLVSPSGTPGCFQADAVEVGRPHVTEEKIEESIAAFEASCSTAGIKYTVKLESGNPFNLFISLARYHDIMVFGLRSIFEYRVSAEEPCVTLARLVSAGVRPIIAESSEFRPIRKALIAYSGSMESAKTMKRFIQLRPWADVRLKIVTFERSEDEARQLLYDASEYCRAHGFTVETESNPGPPKDFLLVLATMRQADVIVMGSSARSLLLKRVLGDTAMHIIKNTDRPLFLCQ